MTEVSPWVMVALDAAGSALAGFGSLRLALNKNPSPEDERKAWPFWLAASTFFMILFWITGQDALLVNELFILGVTVVVVTKDNNSPRSRDTSRYLSLGGFVLCALCFAR